MIQTPYFGQLYNGWWFVQYNFLITHIQSCINGCSWNKSLFIFYTSSFKMFLYQGYFVTYVFELLRWIVYWVVTGIFSVFWNTLYSIVHQKKIIPDVLIREDRKEWSSFKLVFQSWCYSSVILRLERRTSLDEGRFRGI